MLTLLFNPYKGTLYYHLLKHGFMQGYTWPEDDETDHEDVSDGEWMTDEVGWYIDDEEQVGGNEEAIGHDEDDGYEEKEDTHNSSMASKLENPHLQDLLKKGTNERADRKSVV